MRKPFLYAWRSLALSYKANGYPFVIDFIGRLYDGTIYQLIQVLLLSRILDAFATGRNLELSNFYWIAAVYAISSLVKIAFQSYHGGREVLFQSKLEGYLNVVIAKKLTELDPTTFKDPKFQNTLSQVDGVVGSI